MSVPEALKSKGEYELELRANRTAQRPDDDRELSIAVCNIEIRGQRSKIRDQRSEIRGQTSDQRFRQ